ncbi:Plexin A3 [Triplophysa tibetana]|uniref:Plexin A3 n=1 Tax=Triplophysa tibetana TaxID=1572043 RepID=A0A5A9ND89_9TELE|nr:Plexin A3 [Triplophysa tibetana]
MRGSRSPDPASIWIEKGKGSLAMLRWGEQLLVNSITQPALLYENLAVSEGNPILRDMLFSPDHQYIYTLTDKEEALVTQGDELPLSFSLTEDECRCNGDESPVAVVSVWVRM